jgi:transcriptional antiterminator NusG
MALRRYVVQVSSGYEQLVKSSLEEKIAEARSELQKCFGQIIAPSKNIIEMRLKQNLHASIFVEMDMKAADVELLDDEDKPLLFKDEIYRTVGNVHGVLGIGVSQHWYVVQAYSGYEKSVKLSLEERIIRARPELQKCFGEVLVPTEEVVEMREGQKRKSDRKLFPGYVLVQMDMEEVDNEQTNEEDELLPLRDEMWHFVKDVPKVLSFIGGTRERPAHISDKEADVILQRVQEAAEKPRPKVLFEVGEVVRVIKGPFRDFNGIVEEVSYDKNRLRVALRILGRSTPVELEFGQVEKE